MDMPQMDQDKYGNMINKRMETFSRSLHPLYGFSDTVFCARIPVRWSVPHPVV